MSSKQSLYYRESEEEFEYENLTPKQIADRLEMMEHPETIINSKDVLIEVVSKCVGLFPSAAYGEWFNLCEKLVTISGVNLNKMKYDDEIHHFPLSLAIEAENMQLIDLLLSHGADPNLQVGFRGRNVMINLAIDQGSMEIVNLLLKYGADVNKFNGLHSGRFSPWCRAYFFDRHEILDFLLNLPNISLKKSKILQDAVKKSDVNTVGMLIKNHLSILDLNFGNFTTPLYDACNKQSVEIVKLLAPLPGIDINLGELSHKKETPLQKAIRNSNIEIITLLISHGAKFTESDEIDANNVGINLGIIKFETRQVSKFQQLLHSNLPLSDLTFEYK